MAIPNTPNWSVITSVEQFVAVNIPKPEKPFATTVSEITPGPAQIGISEGRNNSRYWVAYYDEGSVFIAGSENGMWSNPELLFELQEKPLALSITFDQAGRPIVLYQAKGEVLTLYWYNPVTAANEMKLIATGIDPNAGLDVITNTSAEYSDVMLFYTRNNAIYMRIQRERFEVEHETPAKLLKGLDITSTGMRVDNRYQVVYQYHDENYVPPPPQPPLPPEFTGDYVYMQGGPTQFGLEKPLINSAQHDDISLAFNLYRMDGVLAGLNPTWGAYGIPIFCEGEQTTIYPIPLSYNTGFHFDINNTSAGYLREYKLLAASKFHLSFMYIEKVLYLVLVINGRKNTAVMPFVLSDGRWSVSIIGNVLTVKKGEAILFTTEVQRGTDASEKYPKPGRFGAYTLGPLYRMWRQNFGGALYAITTNIAGVETHYPLMTYNSQTQESIPPGNNISIYNYKPANWKYIAV